MHPATTLFFLHIHTHPIAFMHQAFPRPNCLLYNILLHPIRAAIMSWLDLRKVYSHHRLPFLSLSLLLLFSLHSAHLTLASNAFRESTTMAHSGRRNGTIMNASTSMELYIRLCCKRRTSIHPAPACWLSVPSLDQPRFFFSLLPCSSWTCLLVKNGMQGTPSMQRVRYTKGALNYKSCI